MVRRRGLPSSRRPRALVVLLALCLAAILNLAAPRAEAVEPDQRLLLAAGQGNCTDFSEGKVWQTSSSWVRMRYRLCLRETSDGTHVRPVVQVQGDWPTDCSLSVGFPPSASVGCSISGLKFRHLTFRAYQTINSKPVVFRIPLQIRRPNGRTYSGWCNFAPNDAAKQQTIWTGYERKTNAFTCQGPSFKRLRGVYRVATPGPRGDVSGDGIGEQLMSAGAMEFISS